MAIRSVNKRAARACPKKVTSARWAAWRTVYRTFEEDAWTDRALAGEATHLQLDSRDRAQAQWLAYGTVQHAKLIDHIIGVVGKRPLRKIDGPVLAALRCGIYQLRFGQRTDHHAAVTESVEIVRAVVGERAVSFTNAVLRRAQVDSDAIVAALNPALLEEFATLHSFPEWVVTTMVASYPEDGLAALTAQNEPFGYSAYRVNELLAATESVDQSISATGVTVDTISFPNVPVIAEARLVTGSTAAVAPLVDQGLLHPQSPASMLVAHALAPEAGERVLDMCAAPGGKTMHIAQLMRGEGSIVACDIHEHRAASISFLAAKAGASGMVRVSTADATTYTAPMPFDRILIDAPCSGWGVLSRRPDARWKQLERNWNELQQIQRALLRNAVSLVRPGGIIVYSTCTMTREECESQIEWALSELPLVRDELPETVSSIVAGAADGDSEIRLWPHRHDTEGFYIARLRRSDSSR